MDYAEFNALIRGLRNLSEKGTPSPRIGAGTDASAIHGRLGAQVALLQSPILPAASSPYTKRKNFRALVVDKTHTCSSVVETLLAFQGYPIDSTAYYGWCIGLLDPPTSI